MWEKRFKIIKIYIPANILQIKGLMQLNALKRIIFFQKFPQENNHRNVKF